MSTSQDRPGTYFPTWRMRTFNLPWPTQSQREGEQQHQISPTQILPLYMPPNISPRKLSHNAFSPSLSIPPRIDLRTSRRTPRFMIESAIPSANDGRHLPFIGPLSTTPCRRNMATLPYDIHGAQTRVPLRKRKQPPPRWLPQHAKGAEWFEAMTHPDIKRKMLSTFISGLILSLTTMSCKFGGSVSARWTPSPSVTCSALANTRFASKTRT